ncbi:unnamed protein product, partial [Laminaria digitata]
RVQPKKVLLSFLRNLKRSPSSWIVTNQPSSASRGGFMGVLSINIDPDDNCFGTSWLLTVLVRASQRPSRLDHVLSTLQDVGRPDQAFGGL